MFEKPALRDVVAHRILNWVARVIATDWYEKSLEDNISYGIRSRIRDHKYQMDPPPTLEELWVPDFRRHKD